LLLTKNLKERPEEKLFLLAFEEEHCAHLENSTSEIAVAPMYCIKYFLVPR
jgi:hypothetical protein